jgi:hypothetical protein
LKTNTGEATFQKRLQLLPGNYATNLELPALFEIKTCIKMGRIRVTMFELTRPEPNGKNSKQGKTPKNILTIL